MKTHFTIFAGLYFLIAFADVGLALTLRTVILNGDSAPGTNATFSSIGDIELNNAGQTAFQASLIGSGITSNNDRGLWSEGSDSLAQVAREGDQAPGAASGVRFNVLYSINLNDAGHVAFLGNLVGTGIGFGNNWGLWSNRQGSVEPVALGGQHAPGTGSGVNFYGQPVGAIFNDAGQMAFFSVLSGTGVNSNNSIGLWSEGDSTLALVARRGNINPANGIPFSLTNYDFENMDFNDAGQTAFTENLNSSTSHRIWLHDGGSFSLIAGHGTPAPGTGVGVNFLSLNGPALNNLGETAFRARISGTGVISSNNIGIWSNSGGSFSLVARTGTAAVGTPTGVTFIDLAEYPVINDAGQLAFSGRLTGPGVNLNNDTGLWSEDNGTSRLVAREGDPAPGLGPGVSFYNLSGSPSLNQAGRVAFSVELTNVQSPSTREYSIWAEGPDDALKLIAKIGDQLDVDDGPGIDLRTVQSLSFSEFNDLGQVAYLARFTNGSEGVFVSNLAASADFDDDGDVDGRDFLAWQRGESPGRLSAGNLELWRDQFGSNYAFSQVIAVPEISSLVFAIAAAASFVFRRGSPVG